MNEPSPVYHNDEEIEFEEVQPQIVIDRVTEIRDNQAYNAKETYISVFFGMLGGLYVLHSADSSFVQKIAMQSLFVNGATLCLVLVVCTLNFVFDFSFMITLFFIIIKLFFYILQIVLAKDSLKSKRYIGIPVVKILINEIVVDDEEEDDDDEY